MANVFDEIFKQLELDVASTLFMENNISGKIKSHTIKKRNNNVRSKEDTLTVATRDPVEIVNDVLNNCKQKRKLKHTHEQNCTVTDYKLSQLARFTDKFNLTPYTNFLQYVPRLVNVVTCMIAPLIPKTTRCFVQCGLNVCCFVSVFSG